VARSRPASGEAGYTTLERIWARPTAEVDGIVFLGVGLPDNRIRAPNERVVLPMLERGAEAAAYLWSELARLGTRRSRAT